MAHINILRQNILVCNSVSFSRYGCMRYLKTKASGQIVYDSKPYLDFVTKGWPLYKFSDRTRWKLNENSISIAIEGNIGSGKEKLARFLADQFELKFIDDTCDDDFWINDHCDPPVDYREYNEMLPQRLQIYTNEKFLLDKDPMNNGKPIGLQHNYYLYRHFYWAYGIANIFNTGYGFVTKRSPFSDIVFAKTMYLMGLCSKEAFDWYQYFHRNASPLLYRPHIIVYLRCPVSKSRDAINKRNIPCEVQSPWLTDKFLETYNHLMESEYLKKMNTHSAIVEVDLNEMDMHESADLHFVMDQLTKIETKLEQRLADPRNVKFLDWYNATWISDKMDKVRSRRSLIDDQMKNVIGIFPPRHLKEVCYNVKDSMALKELFGRDYRCQYNGIKQESDWRYLLKMWKQPKNTNFMADPIKKYNQTIFKNHPSGD